MTLHQVEAQVLENRESGSYMLMKLEAPEVAGQAQSGQFIMLQVSSEPDPLLRRPFAVHNVWSEGKQSGIYVLYDVVGRGTLAMSKIPAGEELSIIGPLGKGFSDCRTGRAILVAGGIGAAPLKFLASKLNSASIEVILFAGARTEGLLHISDFAGVKKVVLATDDGSKGIRGPVTGALEACLDDNCRDASIYAAGPLPMLRKVKSLASLYDVPCELSLEAFMACGIGACNGCVIKALGEDDEPTYIRVCREGPVFDSRRLISF